MNSSSDPMGRPALVVIPARGGSVGVPLKNLEKVGGISLVGRAVRAAVAAAHIATVVVSTDHPRIAEEARRWGADIVERPEELSGATASSESAVLHTLDELEAHGHVLPPVTVLLQCTSPFVDPEDLDAAIARVRSRAHDVVFAAAESFDFQWRLEAGEALEAVGHSAEHRPRRQDRSAHYRETGAFYAMATGGLRHHRHRFFGNLGILEVSPQLALEIDTPHDLWLARRLGPLLGPLPNRERRLALEALVMDFDGVHTDDHAAVDSAGIETVRIHRGDGMGLAALRRAGLPMLILSTEANPVVGTRAAKLGIPVLHGTSDKDKALNRWLGTQDLDPRHVAYVGNDVNDLAALRQVGWPLAVADSHPEVLAVARLVLTRGGGQGALRELAEMILGPRLDEPLPRPDQPVGPERQSPPRPDRTTVAPSVALAPERGRRSAHSLVV